VTGLGWRPGWLTLGCLVLALLFPIWLSQLSTQVFRGADAKVYFAAASLDARGGDPNDAASLIQEGEVLYNLPLGLHRGQPGAYYMAPYGFPRLFTRLSRPLLGLGTTGYYLAILAAITMACLAGLEALMTAMDWDRNRWLPRFFLLLSAPFAEDAFVGNVSAALFLSWALAFLMVRRGRPFVGGLILSVCLVKIPVGAPAAAALIAFPPRAEGKSPSRGARLGLGGGLALGAAAWMILNLVVTGWQATASWWSSLVGYGRALSAGPGTVYNLSEQAGLPSILLGHVPTTTAVIVAALPVGAVLIVVLLRSVRDRGTTLPGATTALALAAGLLLSPYLHLNDLLMEALPLLVVAASPLRPLGRLTLVVWAVGSSVNLLAALTETNVLHSPRQGGAAGFGLVLAVLAFAAVAEKAWRGAEFSRASRMPPPDPAPASR
jgi:hypothetical protein